MIRLLSLGVMLLALVLFGCDQFEGLMPKQAVEETAPDKAAMLAETKNEEVKEATEPVVEKSADEVNAMAIAPADKPSEMPAQFSKPVESAVNEAKGSKAGDIIFVAGDSVGDDLPSVRLIMDGGVEIQKGENAVRLTSKEVQFVQELLNKIR